MVGIEREPGQLLTGQTTGKDVPPPLGEAVAGVQHQPRDGDGRHPHVVRVLHSLGGRAGVNRGATAVVHAVTDHGPAVVPAGLNPVQLVTTLRTVLRKPDVVRFRMNEQSLRIAVPVAPDLR